jgi:undecaprenyl phosphate-alpha-L-ara4N flippase subunit ArnF
MHTACKSGLALVSCSVLLVSSAQLLLKIGVLRMHGLTGFIERLDEVDLPGFFSLAGGLLCYGLSFLIWQRALGKLPLSIAYPLLGLSYPLVYIASLLLPPFDDSLTAQRTIGVLLIFIGAALLAPKQNAAHAGL